MSPTAPAAASQARVYVALSGGVDSAVAAWLLREQGLAVRAIFMKNWEEDDRVGHCHAAEDLHEAEAVCAKLGLELDTVNLSADYWERVFSHFLDEQRAGRTANPDVLCNPEIKFGALLEHAHALGVGTLATGHYARIAPHGDDRKLMKGRDANKDQSYFLHRLDQSQLNHALFPLGELTKDEVRSLARRAGLPNHARQDSTGLCFIGERPFGDFLGRFLPESPGPIVNLGGETLGIHKGLAFYTLGQRQGLHIGGRTGSSGEPWYIAEKRVASNTLVVVQGDHPLLYRSELIASDPHWIGSTPTGTLHCSAKCRYRQPDEACTVEPQADGRLRVCFTLPQRAPTPGQAVVFYDGDICLGGAVIESVGLPT
jgi:tRNA-specific 2-thiouridylase